MGFTDLITKLPMYKTVLTTNIAPYWTNPEIDRVTRSWNDDYRCLTCTGERANHPVFEGGKDFWMAITDQHFPASIPALNGNCMAIVRMSNMALWLLGIQTVW